MTSFQFHICPPKMSLPQLSRIGQLFMNLVSKILFIIDLLHLLNSMISPTFAVLYLAFDITFSGTSVEASVS